MKKLRILWTDDEIENLRPHIYFLSERGYEVETCSNGNDAIELIKKNPYDLLLLDEHMSGLSGIETLKLIKEIRPEIPVVMVTKSEEETLMDTAIGSEIADFLIKPVKPNQVLLVLKKNLEQKRLVTEKTTTDYSQEFVKISSMIGSASSVSDWTDIYRKMVYWEIELDKMADTGLYDILQNQEYDANNSFCRFVVKNYLSWLTPGNPNRPRK
jgi:DNA-binding NtrC family response regulator